MVKFWQVLNITLLHLTEKLKYNFNQIRKIHERFKVEASE